MTPARDRPHAGEHHDTAPHPGTALHPGTAPHPDTSPHRIGRAVATQRWEDVTMLHWREDPERIASLLPPGVQPDVADGSAWVSLVPFRMAQLTVPPLPVLPGVGTFPETNVRTYVTGSHGPAVWFLSLDVPRIFMVPAARTAFGVPYTWARMAIARRGPEIRYLARRRFPGPRGATSHVGVRVGPPRTADPLDRFLLNRWGAYSTVAGRLRYAPVAHDPWPLHEAEVTCLHDELGAAAGLPVGSVERVHHAPVVGHVRFARTRRA